MGINDERIRVAFESLGRALRRPNAGPTPTAIPRPKEGGLAPRWRRAAAEEDLRREIETFRRRLRGYRYVAEPAAVYLALAGGSLLACAALAALTAGSAAAFAAAFSRSIVVQIGTLVILPLLAVLAIRTLGGWWVARSRARRRIWCPHCAGVIAIHAPWECPHCLAHNEATAFYAFLNRCRSCRREPEGWWCERCGGKVALAPAIVAQAGDSGDVPCAKRIGWRTPPPPLAPGAAGEDAGTPAPRAVAAEPSPALERPHLPPPRDDARQGLIDAFALPDTASVEDIAAAFEESRDSDAKTYLARQKEALERAARPAVAREGARQEQPSPRPLPPRPPRGIQPKADAGNEEAAATAALRQRVIGHLGAGPQASWSELQAYFDQADSDTKAAMDPGDAAWLQRMADAERKAAALADRR